MIQPRIGITSWLRPLPTYLGEETLLYTLGHEYVDSVLRAGGVPLILPHSGNVDTVLDALDGLVLSGGGDVHPTAYGDEHTDISTDVDRAADDWEIALVRGAAERGMPTLGICRGMQVMSVAFGGRLAQDMAGLEGHPDMHELSAQEILDARHPVELEPACAIARVYGSATRTVNTIHHQAVIDAGKLRVTGRGPAGVVEAVEPGWDWPAIGVQWHPEKLADDPLERRLFDHLVHAAVGYAEATRLPLDEKTIEELA